MQTKTASAAPLVSIGIDIGKDVFHFVGFDTKGKMAFRRKIKRLALVEGGYSATVPTWTLLWRTPIRPPSAHRALPAKILAMRLPRKCGRSILPCKSPPNCYPKVSHELSQMGHAAVNVMFKT